MKDLLLLLCRYPFDAANRDILSEMIGKVQDWHKMSELINTHGIIALAAYNIKEAGLEKDSDKLEYYKENSDYFSTAGVKISQKIR